MKRVRERESLWIFAKSVFAPSKLDCGCTKGIPRRSVMFVKRGQFHPCVEQGGDDLAEAMVEMNEVGGGQWLIMNDVAELFGKVHAVGFEVGIFDNQQAVRPWVGQ